MAQQPLYVYVSGPYSATAADRGPEEQQRTVDRNVERARQAALALVAKGHRPLVPHTMMEGWEDGGLVDRPTALDLSLSWLRRCDVLLFLGSSPGADLERKEAEELGIRVYETLEAIPEASVEAPAMLPDRGLEILLTEYRECAASYRHTYATIWSAGGILGAGAAALLAFSKGLVFLFSPFPVIVWYLALFVPMDSYGELRGRRLKEIEKELARRVPDAQMWHFRRYEAGRKPTPGSPATDKPPWRVKSALRLAMIFLFGLQVLAIIVAWPELLATFEKLFASFR